MKKTRYIAMLAAILMLLSSITAIALPEKGKIYNVAPAIDLSVKPKKKPVDIVILTDYTGTKRSALDTQINILKADFTAVNVDPVFHIISDVKKVGTQQDELYMYRRYGRFIYKVSYYAYYKDYGLEYSYSPYTIEKTVLWEEAQGLYSSPESLPKRQPQNVGFTKSSLIIDEGRPNETDKLRKYYNVTIGCTNDVKSSYSFEEEIYYKNYARAIEYVYGSIIEEKAVIDSAWTREELIGYITYDVLSLDFDKLNALPLRAGSDRHMIFLSDSYGKNYGAGSGNYFCFGDMADALKNYIASNNFSLYGVVPDETKDMTLLPDRVSKILPFGNTSLFYMKDGQILQLGDPALANTLPHGKKMFPKEAADVGAVKEIINPSGGPVYLLMDNGTIKYVPNGTNNITTLPGIGGVTKVIAMPNSVWTYAINSSGQAYKISGSDVYPLNNTFFCVNVLPVGAGSEILLASDGTPYMQYSCYDNKQKIETRGFSQVLIKDRNTDALSYMGPIKDIEYVNPSGSYSLYPIAVQFQNDVVRQYTGLTSHRIDSGRYTYWYQCIYAETPYYIDTPGVDRIEKTGADILIFYKNGSVKSLAPNLRLVHDREEGDYYVIEFRNYLVNVPLANIQKSVYVYPNKIFMTDISNNTYMYDGASATYMGNNIKSVNSYRYSSSSKIYLLKTDGTVRELTCSGTSIIADKTLPYSDIENIYTSAINAYLVSKRGYVYGTGNTRYGQLGYRDAYEYTTSYVSPLPTTISLADNTKTYLSLLELFKSINESLFFGAGQYAAAFNSIYKRYENFSASGSTYVLLGEELEYRVNYSDYENDPEYCRLWRISHDSGYFDNGMGLSKYHDPSGFTNDPPAKLDKVGRYIISLNVRDDPKADDRFDNYRLWNLGDQSMIVYVHRKPVAEQRITVEENGSGSFSVKAYDAGSYDFDHNLTRADKGIVAREWRWKDSSEMNWHYEQMNKADCRPDREYILQLRVQDAEGVWSDYNTIEIADDPPVALFEIEKDPIYTNERLMLRDMSYPQSFFAIDRWHWIIKKYTEDGTIPAGNIQDEQFGTSNDGAEDMEGYDVNVKTDFSDTGEGRYRIYLRVMDGGGRWSDGGTDSTYDIGKFYSRDITVQESFKISSFRVVKVRDLHLESYYYDPATGGYRDKPMGVNEMAIDYRNFGGLVDGLTKGYTFEFEIDTVNFNEDHDTIEIIPRFYTCDDYYRDEEERDLYWENSRHEILKAGEGGHEAWSIIKLTSVDRRFTEGSEATWRGRYLIPGTAWAVPLGTSPANAKASRLNRDIIVNFEIKGYRDGELKYDYNLKQWPLERTADKYPYEIGDVIRYSHTKNNLDDIDVILNRP